MKNRLNVVSDGVMVTALAIAGIVIAGRALDTDLAYKAAAIPVLGNVIQGLRAVVRQVYNP